jgi:hypothetical protein
MRLRPFPVLAVALALAGCGLADPAEREGTWRPTRVNDANLRAMIADPGHLQHGVGDPRGRARQAADAIERLEDRKIEPLPDLRTSRVGR